MNNWFSKLLAEVTEEGRNVFRVVITMMGGMIPALPLVLYLALQSGAWQIYVVLATLIGWLILLAFSAALARQNRANQAMALIIGGLSVLLPTLSALIAGLGLTLSIAEVLVILILTGQTHSGSRATRTLIAVIISAPLTLLIDLFAAWNRVSHPLLQNSAPFIVAAVVLALGAYVVRQFREFSLRTKLVIAFTALAIVSVGAVSLITDRVVRAELTQQVGDELKTSTVTQAQLVSGLMNQQLEVLKSFALSKVMQDQVEAVNNSYTGNTASIQAQINTLDGQWRVADAADNDNAPLVAAVLNNEAAGDLREFKDTFPQHVEVFLTDKYGANVASTNRTSDYYQADEDWWQAAYNNGQGALYIGQPEFDDSAQTLAVIIAVPLYAHGTQEMVGILRTTYRLDDVVSILAQFGTRGGADLLLPDGQVLREKGDIVPLDETTLTRLRHNATTDFEQFVYDGVLSMVSQSPIIAPDPDAGAAINNLGWVMVLDEDPAVILAPVNTATRAALLTSLGALAFAVVIALFLSYQLTNPLNRLTETAMRFGAGDLTARVEITSKDEIGLLATVFNNMSAQLKNTLEGLEQRVADRTRNLELAAEVGRTVSQLQALDVMLTNAAELIREQFGLYYVQVYLTNPSQTYLNLQAGTGHVGTELLARNHRLPLNTGSINGRASIEKKSVVISDTTASITFKSNPLLPDTRSEMAVPLLIGEKVVGVLDMQSDHTGSLNQDVLPAFEALAGQLAIAIQNAAFLAESEQARAEVEAQAQRLSRANWVEYLDAIHKPEETGFVFEQNKIAPLPREEQSKLQTNPNALSAPINVTGEELGNLVVELEGAAPGTRTTELVNTVARQVAQRIESLRLLESAERYRLEVEEASRRITSEYWKDYKKSNTDKSLSFLYDLKEVRKYENNGNGLTESSGLSLPIKIRDEKIGQVVVQGLENKDGVELANAVIERLSQHIESLRLLEKAEESRSEIQYSQERLSEALEIARLANWEYDVEKDIFTFNDNFYSIFHTTAKEAGGYYLSSGEYTQRFVHPEDAALVGGEIGRALNSTESHYTTSLEHRALFMDGGVGYISVNMHVERDDQGKIARFYGANQNVTERRQAEEVLRAREVQLSTALEQTEKLSNAGLRFTQASDLQELVAVVVEMLSVQKINRAILGVFNYSSTNELEGMNVVANWWNGSGHESTPVGTHYPTEVLKVLPLFISTTPVFFNDTLTDSRLDPSTLEILKQRNIRAVAALPLYLGTRQIGTLLLESEEAHEYTQDETILFTAMAPQIATVLDNRRQFERAQQQAERESKLNIISQKIQNATTVEAVLQIAARELGHALGAPMTVAQLSMKDKN